MALLRQCLKLQRERNGASAEDIDFPPVDAQTLWAMRLAGLQIGGGRERARDLLADSYRKPHQRWTEWVSSGQRFND